MSNGNGSSIFRLWVLVKSFIGKLVPRPADNRRKIGFWCYLFFYVRFCSLLKPLPPRAAHPRIPVPGVIVKSPKTTPAPGWAALFTNRRPLIPSKITLKTPPITTLFRELISRCPSAMASTSSAVGNSIPTVKRSTSKS